ncbi:MAG TPA: metallopeptidase family protein [Thermoanaerobaculia bacterium]|jgi:predicted Zn-dependent protease with MMP-like domain
MHLTRTEFEQLVEEAIGGLPPEFAELLENIAVVVEEEPSDDDLAAIDDDDHDHGDGDGDGHDHHHSELLGIYRGVALTHRTHDMLPMLPDQIAIFRGPILRIARSRRDAIAEVRDTVIHELGHYFGLGDDDMAY